MSKTSTKKMLESLKKEMNTTIDNKDEFLYEPKNNVINNILNYSKALSIKESKNLKFFEMVLN